MEIYPKEEEFLKYVEEGYDLIFLWFEELGDVFTPIGCFSALIEREKDDLYAYLLESVEHGEHLGRYSFIGISPYLIIKGWEDRLDIKEKKKPERIVPSLDPLLDLKSYIYKYKPAPQTGLPRFHGGGVGYVGYDYVRFIEDLPTIKEDPINVPLLLFIFAELLCIFDHLHHTIKLITPIIIDSQIDPLDTYKEGIHRLNKFWDILINASPNRLLRRRKLQPFPLESEVEKEDFLSWVNQAKEYIKAGEIIQVVLSLRLWRKTLASPISIYRALRKINPSPYMFLIYSPEFQLIGSSPEMLTRKEGDKIETCPIAGTRRRGETEEEDKELEISLLNDDKEKAEHVMLVDLGRNDIGKVAELNTIKIPKFMEVERYSHVMHIVSYIVGRINKNEDAFSLLRACFPAGTVAGAPKVRACQIIDELEAKRRSIYAGAVGYFDYSGNLDTCITIRTILLKNNIAYIQTGAGIVADSIPEREYAETQAKAKALISALDYAENSFY
jgi:anthranilate synthase component 1